MDVTSILNGFAGGKMDRNAINALAGCCSGKDGNSNFIFLIIILLLFCSGNGFNNNCGCNNGNVGCGNQCCGNWNVNPCAPYYTYYDPCCCQRSSRRSRRDSNLYCIQPVGGNWCQPQNCNNNCGGFSGNSWWIWIIILLLFAGGRGGFGGFGGLGSVGGCAATLRSEPRVKENACREDRCDDNDACDELDFTD